MAHAIVSLKDYHCTGKAECVGGKHPDPPLDMWPLLVWSPTHETHGKNVFTEDGAATVADIATAACETPDYEALAGKFKTTAEHVAQAVDYAFAAGFLTNHKEVD
jgi:hypothetical protein